MSFALITGASKGVGKSFADSLAKRKYDLLLVARSGELLEQLSGELSSRYGVTCRFMAADLSLPEASKKISEWIERERFEISILINNAGFGLWGPFHELSIEEQNEMIAVNISALVNLTYLVLPKLMQK